MLSCLAPTWEFSPFPCKGGLEQAVLWGSGPHSRGGKPGLDWLCHPSSLVMAGDTRVTRSHEWIEIAPVWTWRISFSWDLSPGFPLGSVLLSLLRQCLGVVGLSFPIHSWDAFPSPVQCFARFVPGSPRRLGTSCSSSHPRGPLGDTKAVSPLSSCPPASDGIAGHCSTCLWCWGCPLWTGCCLLDPA